MPDISIAAIVSARNDEPYVHLKIDGQVIAQLKVSEARGIGNDLILSASRAEADAMLCRFWREHNFPDKALMALMQDFRDFRLGLDLDPVETSYDEDVEDGDGPKG